jgi:transcriptional regulator CtsR
MLMSDLIASRILELLSQSENGIAEIRRNTLADKVGCVPSQINYVISSRFTPERGYIVESKRGGGGYIRITEVRADGFSSMMHVINSIGNEIDARTAKAIIESLLSRDFISLKSAKAIHAAIKDDCYKSISPEQRDTVRAAIFKQMLMSQI